MRFPPLHACDADLGFPVTEVAGSFSARSTKSDACFRLASCAEFHMIVDNSTAARRSHLLCSVDSHPLPKMSPSPTTPHTRRLPHQQPFLVNSLGGAIWKCRAQSCCVWLASTVVAYQCPFLLLILHVILPVVCIPLLVPLVCRNSADRKTG